MRMRLSSASVSALFSRIGSRVLKSAIGSLTDGKSRAADGGTVDGEMGGVSSRLGPSAVESDTSVSLKSVRG